MKYCGKCGKENIEDDLYCIGCGAQLSDIEEEIVSEDLLEETIKTEAEPQKSFKKPVENYSDDIVIRRLWPLFVTLILIVAGCFVLEFGSHIPINQSAELDMIKQLCQDMGVLLWIVSFVFVILCFIHDSNAYYLKNGRCTIFPYTFCVGKCRKCIFAKMEQKRQFQIIEIEDEDDDCEY